MTDLPTIARQAGIDPTCTIWLSYPGHTCADRDGLPIGSSGKACFASARLAVLTDSRRRGSERTTG